MNALCKGGSVDLVADLVDVGDISTGFDR